MRWSDALDLHIRMAKHCQPNNRRWRDEMEAFTRAYFSETPEEKLIEMAEVYAGDIAETLDAAPTTFVGRNVMSMIYDGAEALREMPSEALREYELPTRFGFMVFEEPFRYRDFDKNFREEYRTIPEEEVDEISMWVRAISWHPTMMHWDAESSWVAHRAAGTPEEIVARRHGLIEDLKRMGLMFHLWIDPPEAQRLLNRKPDGDPVKLTVDRPLYVADLLPWGFDLPWHEVATPKVVEYLKDDPENEGLSVGTEIEPHVAEFRRFLLSLARFMEQRILDPEIMIPDKALKKRWDRQFRMRDRLDGDEAKVLVLRRIEEAWLDSKPGPTEIGGVMRRHVVREHWRKFYCPSRKLPVGDPDAYVWRRVEPYERGEGPIVLKHPVTAVTR